MAILAGGSGNAQPQAGPEINIDNWLKHPEILEIRKIFNTIAKGKESGTYKSEERNFDTESTDCSTYPVKSETLVLDNKDRVRMYGIVQLGPHREPFQIIRYYDTHGTLRFVFVDRYITSIRIYLGPAGKVFWAVEKNESKLTRLQYDNEDWETKPPQARDAKIAFYEPQSCPEIAS